MTDFLIDDQLRIGLRIEDLFPSRIRAGEIFPRGTDNRRECPRADYLFLLLRRRAEQILHFLAENAGRADDKTLAFERVVARADFNRVLSFPAGEGRPARYVNPLTLEQESQPIERSEEHTSELQSRLHLLCP